MKQIDALQAKGVRFLAAESCYVAADVKTERIAANVAIGPGCRLEGAQLSIGPGCEIGSETPATVKDCQLGANVTLGGGYFERSTFLDGFRAGSGAHVRSGCLFEEGSSLAQSVGTKLTVFLPWVTAGSLVNFCDILMAGGTSRENHSEIGSSYVHFNYTPRQDKATASLLGDVPHGVLLQSAPIFLGGQGGLVGPCRIAFGTVIPAGQVWRDDVPQPDRFVAKVLPKHDIDIPTGRAGFPGLSRVVRNNLEFIGNILALDAWYRAIRAPAMTTPHAAACHAGALQRFEEVLAERMARLDELARKVAVADAEDAFVEAWKSVKPQLEKRIACGAQALVPSEVKKIGGRIAEAGDYLGGIQSLTDIDRELLTLWLSWRRDEAVLYGKSGSCEGEE